MLPSTGSTLLPSELTVCAPLQWSGQHWSAPPPGPAASAPGRLELLTWNVLFDRYDDGQLHSEARRPLLLEALAAEAGSGVSLIALQELQWPLLEGLLAAEWLRDGWQVVLPGPPTEVDDCGLVLLSRLPVEAAGFCSLRPRKGLLVARLQLASGPLLVATTHLSSDYRQDASSRRSRQLGLIQSIFGQTDLPTILLGDFNDESPEPEQALGLRDLACDHPGLRHRPTFDPTTNALARVNSPTETPLRLDRVLASAGWRGELPRLVGTQAVGGLHPSDHYGLRMEVRPLRDPLEDSAPGRAP